MISFELQWHGRQTYPRALALMNRAEERARMGQFTLLGFEFDPVITLGRRARAGNDVLMSPSELENQGVPVVAVERGGEATFHGPGQLVIYPVMDLRMGFTGVRSFVARLQEVTCLWLSDLGVECFTNPCESGVFTPKGKIAFVGLRIRQGISTHGLALNLTNDLASFAWIRSCGRLDRAHDRISGWVDPPAISEAYQQWTQIFLNTFTLTPEKDRDLFTSPIVGI